MIDGVGYDECGEKQRSLMMDWCVYSNDVQITKTTDGARVIYVYVLALLLYFLAQAFISLLLERPSLFIQRAIDSLHQKPIFQWY
jgi:hypothetical protein